MPYTSNASPSKVLVVNDARDTLELVEFSLQREGYQVVTAMNGREALEIALSQPLDVIISDVVMPEMDGIELCARLKQNLNTAETPILLFSALRTSEIDSLSGLHAGADDYLEVPFRQQELLVKIARLIERSKLERYYRQIVEFSPNIIYTCDKNRRIVSINQAGLGFFGRTFEELNEKSEIELLASHILNWESLNQAQILSESKIVLKVQNADGELRTVELRRKPFYDNTGELEGFHCVVQDFTERQTAEQALRDSERRYRSLYQDSPLMYFVLDESGTIVSVNQTVAEKLGYSEAELIGKPVFNVFFFEDRLKVVEQIELLKQSPGDIAQWEFRKIHKNKEIVYVSENVRLLPQANGENIFLVICEDITERRQAQNALQQSQARFQTVVENSAVVFVMIDLNGTLTFLEGAVLEKLNRKPTEMVGRSVNDAWRKFPKLLSDVNRALKGESFSTIQELENRFFEANFNPLYDANGNLSGTVGVATDVTERVIAERKAARVIEQLEATLKREELVKRITNAVRGSLQVEDVFQSLVDELGKHLAIDRCHLYLFDETAGFVHHMTQFAAESVSLISEKSIPLSFGEQILPAFKEKGILVFNDVSAESAIKKLYKVVLKPRNVRSLMFVAVQAGEEINGLLSLVTVNNHRNWSKTDVALARAVADQAGIAIRQAKLYQRAETASRREALINRISTAIRSSLQLPEVINTATHKLGEVLDASQVYINFYNPLQPSAAALPEYVYISEQHPKAPTPLPVNYNSNLGRFLLDTRKTIVVDDLDELKTIVEVGDPEIRGNAHRASVKSLVFCPIIVKDSFRGTLFVEQTNQLRRWTEDDVALIEGVAAQLALGIAHAELFELTRRAKREWEETFDAMSDGIFIFDRAGKLVRVNRAGAAMELSTPSELLGKQCCELLPNEDEKSECVIQQVVETRSKITSEKFSKLLKRPLLITDEPLFDDSGELAGVVCTVRDLYELRAAEAVARERQSLLTGILEGVLEPIFAVDTNGKLLWCNKATSETYEIEAAEITKRSFAEMIHFEDRELAIAALDASLQKLPQFYEFRFVTGSGETRYAIFNSVPLMVEAELSSVLWFMRDITQQKIALQQALQAEKLRALGQLASGVAHDFNNGLAAILGRVSLLQRQIEDKNVLQNLSVIQTAAEDSAATVRRIQSFAKQSVMPDFSIVEVTSLLRDSIELTRTRWDDSARGQGINYKVKLNAEKQFHVRGNASELREVFVNLVVNALDAMPDGGELEVNCQFETEFIILKFTDQGDGIPADLRERIFEPFFSTKGVQGTGLGLSVSYGIIEQHGGSINVESEIGKGTTFAITLPASSLPQKQTVPTVSQQSKKNLSVLVVDDEEFVREALIEMVSEFATEVIGAESGKRALSELETHRFDVVLTDFSMPEMDGLDLAEKIHQKWGKVKTVLVTGYGKGIMIAPEKRSHVHAVIGKPFNFEQLSQTLKEVTT